MGQSKSKIPKNALPANFEQAKSILNTYVNNGIIPSIEHYITSRVDDETGAIYIDVSEKSKPKFPAYLVHNEYYAVVKVHVKKVTLL
jgi:hypothetical protein